MSSVVRDVRISTTRFRQYYIQDGRRGASVTRRKGYFASRVRYFANSDLSLNLARLTASGDVELNPGPVKYSVCTEQ